MMLRLWRDHCSAYGVTIVPLASSLLRCASYCSYAAPLPYIITFCSNIFPSYFCASFSPVAFSSIASLLFASIASPHLASLHLASPRFTSSPIAHVFSLLLLVATLLVHPPLSLLPATSPLPLTHISSPSLPPTPSLITPPHRSPSLITLITFGAWHLVDLLVCPPRSTHAPPSAPSPSPYPSFLQSSPHSFLRSLTVTVSHSTPSRSQSVISPPSRSPSPI